VRVEPAVRAEIEGALHEGESLSQFVETAVLQAARRRKADQEFLARGRASLAQAKKSGEFYPLSGVLDELQSRLESRITAHRRAQPVAAGKP
jgi:Arc/MetJ-type ribon-helix-helix transcriptional regulator